MEEGPEVLRFYRDWIAGAPDELMTIVVQRKAPALPGVPPDLVGKRVVGVVCCYAGSIEDGEKVVRPLKDYGSPVLDLCVAKPYLTHQSMFDPSFRPGCWYYVRSCDVAEVNDQIIDFMDSTAARSRLPSPASHSGRWAERWRVSVMTRPLQWAYGRLYVQHRRKH